MEKNVTSINGETTINIAVSVRFEFKYVKKIMFGILLHAVVKTENI